MPNEEKTDGDGVCRACRVSFSTISDRKCLAGHEFGQHSDARRMPIVPSCFSSEHRIAMVLGFVEFRTTTRTGMDGEKDGNDVVRRVLKSGDAIVCCEAAYDAVRRGFVDAAFGRCAVRNEGRPWWGGFRLRIRQPYPTDLSDTSCAVLFIFSMHKTGLQVADSPQWKSAFRR